MHHRSESTAAAIVAAVSLSILLLMVVVGGAAFFLFRGYQRTALSAERALRAEALARMQAERARALAETAVANARSVSNNQKSTVGPEDSFKQEIESILRSQQEAWNSGNLDSFMEHYWKSENLTFSSGGKTTRGWQATLARYREKYPTQDKMGVLTFSELEVTPLDDSAALVLGHWSLERGEPISGNFSLVVRKFDDVWLIMHDHTSQSTD